MSRAKSNRWQTRIDVDEAIVVICHLQFACIFAGVAIRVSDEASLPLFYMSDYRNIHTDESSLTYVVVEFVPGKGESIRAVFSIQQAVILVFVASDADGGEVIVVHPNFG